MYKAKDIMSSQPISASKEQTVKEALDLLAKHGISGLPVVDENDKVIGIISDTDIIRYSEQKSIVPHTGSSFWISPYTEIAELASVRSGFELLHKTQLENVMTKKVYSVTEDTPASDVAKLMNRRNINRIPVVNDDGKLVGIVTRADLIQCMANLE